MDVSKASILGMTCSENTSTVFSASYLYKPINLFKNIIVKAENRSEAVRKVVRSFRFVKREEF